MILPATVESNTDFEHWQKSKASSVEKFDLLMRSIRTSHKLNEAGVCLGCLQDLTYLVYTHQVECFKLIKDKV
jgi:hypothetical protein